MASKAGAVKGATGAKAAAEKVASLLSVEDFRRDLVAKAAEVAPSDVTGLVRQVETILERLAEDATAHPRLAQRAKVALHLLTDHAVGACPQIPYQTVALLAAALFYYLNPMDVIPDWIPGAGTADDALVIDLAWEMGHAGIERYLTWKGVREPKPAPPIGRPAVAPPPAKASVAVTRKTAKGTPSAKAKAPKTPAVKAKAKRATRR